MGEDPSLVLRRWLEMALRFESSFRKEPYKECEKCPKCTAAREEYSATIAEVEGQDPRLKSRCGYYLLAE